MYKNSFADWKARTNPLQKLQTVYVLVAAVAAVLAGLVGLLDIEVGRTIVQVTFLSGALFVINLVVSAVITSFVELPAASTATTKKK